MSDAPAVAEGQPAPGFELASDTGERVSLEALRGHELAEAYGVRVQKERDGKRSMGVDRSTFLIDASGTVTTVLRGVDPATHAGDVLAELDARG